MTRKRAGSIAVPGPVRPDHQPLLPSGLRQGKQSPEIPPRTTIGGLRASPTAEARALVPNHLNASGIGTSNRATSGHRSLEAAPAEPISSADAGTTDSSIFLSFRRKMQPGWPAWLPPRPHLPSWDRHLARAGQVGVDFGFRFNPLLMLRSWPELEAMGSNMPR